MTLNHALDLFDAKAQLLHEFDLQVHRALMTELTGAVAIAY